jgi:hypothetical protein
VICSVDLVIIGAASKWTQGAQVKRIPVKTAWVSIDLAALGIPRELRGMIAVSDIGLCRYPLRRSLIGGALGRFSEDQTQPH